MSFEKNDKFDYLIAMAELDAKNDDVEIFESLDTSDVVLSNMIDGKIAKLIEKECGNSRKNMTKVRRVLSRVAVVALVIISVMFTAMMSVSAVRSAVWNAVVEWYDKYISVEYKPDIPSTPPAVIEDIRKPALLPTGAEEEVIVQNKSSYIAEYYVGDDLCLMFRQSLLDKGEINVDDETAKREDVKNGNFTGVLFTYEKNDNIKIIWNDGEYTYTLTGYGIDSEILIMIARSVK